MRNLNLSENIRHCLIKFSFNPPMRNLNEVWMKAIELGKQGFQSANEEFKHVWYRKLPGVAIPGFNPPMRNLNEDEVKKLDTIVKVSIRQ
jgi:hypothetical protein